MTTKIKKEVVQFCPSYFHSKNPGWRQRVTRAEAKECLLHYQTWIANGFVWEWKTKHIGAGVYEIWLERTLEVS